MKKTFISAFLPFLLCLSLLSCQGQSLPQQSEPDSTDDIHFEESPHTENLFGSMTEDNYFDVTEFSVGSHTENGGIAEFAPVISFSFIPHELRVFDTIHSYRHNVERFSDLNVDTYSISSHLKSLMNASPIRALKPDSNQKDAVISRFSEDFGIAYSLKFAHNIKRSDTDVSIIKQRADYDFLVSPLTKNNTYYLFDNNSLTVTEVNGDSLSFLEKATQDWFSRSIFSTHIAFVDKIEIEIEIKDGTTDGICGVKNILLEHYTTDADGVPLHPYDIISSEPTNVILSVTAHYDGNESHISDIQKYRKFYRCIVYSSLDEIASNESLQEQLKTVMTDMTMKIHLKCDDQYKALEYRFFADDSVLINGVYVGKMTDGQLDNLISAVGLMLSPDESDSIDFYS